MLVQPKWAMSEMSGITLYSIQILNLNKGPQLKW